MRGALPEHLPYNLDCFDIANPKYADVFGFTQCEVDQMLFDAGIEEKRDELKAWYDGYHFGDRSDIYCPWSIMKYLADVQSIPQEKPKAYWVGTSGNELTKAFLGRMPSTVQDDISSLTEGKNIAVTIKEDLNYNQIYTDEDNFWTLRYLTGYLTPSSDSANCVVPPGPGRTVLAIPNREVKDVFRNEIKSWFSQMLMNYQNENVIQTILGDGQIWAGMGFAKQFADNVDIDYAIRADVTKSGGGRGYLVPVEERERKRKEEQDLARQQMQLEMEKTRSEAIRNAAGAANLNNSGGFNGGAA